MKRTLLRDLFGEEYRSDVSNTMKLFGYQPFFQVYTHVNKKLKGPQAEKTHEKCVSFFVRFRSTMYQYQHQLLTKRVHNGA